MLDNATMRPLHDLIMHTEHTRIAQLAYVLNRLGIPSRAIKHVKTDALILEIPSRKLKVVEAVCELRYDQLHTLRRDHEHRDPAQRFLNAHAEMSPLSSTDRVFRFSEHGMPLLGRYEKPHREVQPPTLPPPWRDLSEAEARSVVMDGGSLLVQGSLGVGKTHWVRELVKALRSNGKRVDIVAKTHA